MKFAACLEYEGTAFSGWQSQSHARNVQDCVEQALSRVADHEIKTTCSGRTDAGVHATGQVVHFKSAAAREPEAWVRGANTYLPDAVRVRWVCAVADDFHARFSVIRRRYRYVILNAPTPPAVLRCLIAWVRESLDADAMHRAGQALLGEHDFSSYRGAGCQSPTSVRRVEELRVFRDGRFVCIDICANAFLLHMVRNIAGVLIEIGCGGKPADWAAQLLAARDRKQGGVTAKSSGLYLVSVEYDAAHALPGEVLWPRF